MNASLVSRVAAVAVATGCVLGGCVSQRAPTLNPGLAPADPHLAQANALHDAAADNVQLGMAYMQAGNLQRARDKLDRALKQDPANPNVHSVYGLFYERVGDQKKADEEFHTAMRMTADDPAQVNIYAGYLCRQGRVDEGVTKFVQVARNALYRTPEVAYTNMGVCLRVAHRDDEAGTAFRRALAVKPDDPEAVFQMGDLDLAHGRALEARQRLDRFLAGHAGTADLLLLGVRASRTLGDTDGAAQYGKILRTDFPNSEQAQALSSAGNPG